MRDPDKVSSKIVFINQEGPRVGNGIKIYRDRLNMTPLQLANRVEIDVSYLTDLENGYALEVNRTVLERIIGLVGVNKRYNRLTDDRLLDLFMFATCAAPPKLL
jgi:transcriptional regulator with XRE-family HTH domain